MPKVSFNPKPVGLTVREKDAYMSCPERHAAFEPRVVSIPGIQAFVEGFRLSNIEGFPSTLECGPADDVDT